ncbi:hypothetical protein Q8A67_022134 [Cirrhinus molitorella]|uniref:Uncharacterized protein n=1 Tax=Cirrhinus molitorella TaxID=172907 RepID=A0AA88TBW3_9TELE|nr:hypothetical protein Q8A67_022134 [Cirrhinus molitorella]
MNRIKTSMVLLLISFAALNQTTAEYERKAQKRRYDVASLPKKNKELTKLSSLKGRQEQNLDKLPKDFAVLFEGTFSLEMSLYCILLLYAIFQLHCCERICMWGKQKPWPSYVELEMVEME